MELKIRKEECVIYQLPRLNLKLHVTLKCESSQGIYRRPAKQFLTSADQFEKVNQAQIAEEMLIVDKKAIPDFEDHDQAVDLDVEAEWVEPLEEKQLTVEKPAERVEMINEMESKRMELKKYLKDKVYVAQSFKV